jgi:hypothetical protein
MQRHAFAPSSLAKRLSGSTVLVVLALIALASMVFTAVLTRTKNTHRNVSQIASWQEALLASDAGGEVAMAELRKTISKTADVNAFSGWDLLAADGTKIKTIPAGTGKTVIQSMLTGQALRYMAPKLTHTGEGNTEMEMAIVIDAPAGLVDPSKRQWFRVRSTGTTYLPGAAWLAGDRRDLRLRRVSYLRDPKLNKTVTRPQTSRTVEMVVKPVGLEPAIYSRKAINMNNASIVINSYDSRSEQHSTGGLYDAAKAGAEGDIATNSTLIDAGNATIWGDAYTNDGKVLNSANVHGEIDNEYELDVESITSPSTAEPWPALPAAGGYAPIASSAIGGGSTVIAGTLLAPKRYKISGSGQMNVTGGDVVFAPDPVEKLAGRESYVEVWAPGDMKTTGTGGIKVLPGVYAKIFVEGSIHIGGNGNWNANSQPSRLQVFGVKYMGTGQQPTVTIAGNGIIVAAIYAPDHPAEFKATGSGGQMWGSLFADSVQMGGSTHIHYDRALADEGKITDFRVKTWFEDAQ